MSANQLEKTIQFLKDNALAASVFQDGEERAHYKFAAETLRAQAAELDALKADIDRALKAIAEYDTENEALKGEVNHWKSQATALATSVMMDETAHDASPCVTLQVCDDGVWAHFRVGSGHTYSENLSLDEMSKPFADEYASAVAGEKQ